VIITRGHSFIKWSFIYASGSPIPINISVVNILVQTLSIEDKTKIMAFKGKHLVSSKIEIDGSILEHLKQFNYL